MLGIINDEEKALQEIINGEMEKYKTKEIIPILVKNFYIQGEQNGIYEEKVLRQFIYDNTVEVLKYNVGKCFTIQYWDRMIKDCIGRYKNRPKELHCVKEIPITEYEWHVIVNIEEDALKKIMFVLIAYRKLIMGTCSLSKGNIRLPLTYIFRESRVDHVALEQKMDIHKLIKMNYIRQNFACDDTSLILNIYENGDDSDIKFVMTDLTSIITYFNEYYRGWRYTECNMCGKRLKVGRNPRKYCNTCKKERNIQHVVAYRSKIKNKSLD